VARLKASMLANSKLKSKGDGMVSRQAVETVLIAEGLFDNKVCLPCSNAPLPSGAVCASPP
jgi:hypothetical protein